MNVRVTVPPSSLKSRRPFRLKVVLVHWGVVSASTASNQRRNSLIVPIRATRWWSAVWSWTRTKSLSKTISPQPQAHFLPNCSASST